jgi:hypothetical protein
LAFHSWREADHSPPSSAEVKEWVELHIHSPNAPSWRGAQLGGAQGQLYLYLNSFNGTETVPVTKNRTSDLKITKHSMYKSDEAKTDRNVKRSCPCA